MVAPRPVPEIDFLQALAPMRLLIVALGCVLGAAVGFGLGHLFLRGYEARAVLRVATVGLFGPAMPIAEVKARAESKSSLRAVLTSLGEADPVPAARRYKVLAENDGLIENPVVLLTVDGPDLDRVNALCARIAQNLMQASHEAYMHALQDQGARLGQAVEPVPPSATPEQRAQSAAVERWVGDAASLRMATRALVTAHDAEILDQPLGAEAPAKKLILAALGAFVGMLVGLSVALRPARA
jgi:hypothetical protein